MALKAVHWVSLSPVNRTLRSTRSGATGLGRAMTEAQPELYNTAGAVGDGIVCTNDDSFGHRALDFQLGVVGLEGFMRPMLSPMSQPGMRVGIVLPSLTPRP